MVKTVPVFGYGDVEVRRLERLTRNIREGDVLRIDCGDGITARWVYLKVERVSPAGPSWFRGVPQTRIQFSYPGYPKEGSTWGCPWWAPLGGETWDSNDRGEVFRPVTAL